MIKNKKNFTILVSSEISKRYSDYFKFVFGEDIDFVVFDPNKHQVSDCILYTGGADVNPEFYGESKGQYTYINRKRDELEHLMFKMYPTRFKIGICRGSQFLTVMAGGKLIQHVEGHGQTHSIQTSFEMPADHYKNYMMSSSHHQMMYPFNLTKNKYELIAWSEFFRSNTYLKGNNVERSLAIDFLEPEIVFYNKINSLCIQGHPEYENVPEESKEFTKRLIKKYIQK